MNAADYEKIRRLYVEYYEQVREVIAASSRSPRGGAHEPAVAAALDDDLAAPDSRTVTARAAV